MSWQTDFSQLIDDTDVSLSRLKGVLGHSPRRRSSHLGRSSDDPFDSLLDDGTLAFTSPDDASLSGIVDRQKEMFQIVQGLRSTVSRLQTENKQLESQLSLVREEMSSLRREDIAREATMDTDHKLSQFRREILNEVQDLQRRLLSQKSHQDEFGRAAFDSKLLSAEMQELRSFVRQELEAQKRDVDSVRTRLRRFEGDYTANSGTVTSLERRIANLEQDIFERVSQRSTQASSASQTGFHSELDRIKSRLKLLSDQVSRVERGLHSSMSERCSDLEGVESLSSSSSLSEDEHALGSHGRVGSEELEELLDGVL